MYVVDIRFPIAFDVESDDEARAAVEKLLEHFALGTGFTLGSLRDELGAELFDAPSAADLAETLPYVEPRMVSLDYPVTR